MKEPAEANNRKLIRPSLNHVKEQLSQQKRQPQQQPQQRAKRYVPPEQTNAENFYYVKQMQNHTPMVLVLQDGEEIQGTIEWYDRNCLKLSREDAPNVLVYKASIKYLYKEADKPADGAPNGSGASNGSITSESN